MMRSTLVSQEAELKPHGFLRTHRSWIVNPRRLRALEPEGSGDWRVLLEGGAEAPLSRRYSNALEALRRT
jgi:DNA-binding LytR/AlgR family response regulator